MDDKDIIRRVKNGDVESFALLVRRYQGNLIGFLTRMLGDRGLAEDAAQDVFLNIYKALDSFDENRNVPFAAWLFITAKNAAISQIRKQALRRSLPLDAAAELPDSAPGALSVLLSHERRLHVKEALDEVPEPHRSSLLFQLEGKTIREIADLQGATAGAVKSRIHRAKAALVRILSKGGLIDHE
ncbi:RNA polymerase, sigma-24 subunit, ECF subfamily [Desulfatibacillum aliphaticivorans]|uniref:RNA polymerase, sigma-24 subunit, ECF subfamily n=1 Tax=Desulfatibacillum aliphaticivorans TaxID=218208 RepID=B8FN52_DESAL|nr:sigma-70 family RNA polymerase sigma factor [Desulfatibacillum aliphaticivorans]ACL06021.1 RNA polymerase, sigma-24 subunit, ECF subfamily [Desulfatibacillum aliphaticivorans]